MGYINLDKFPSAEIRSQDGNCSIRVWSYAYKSPDIKDGNDADWHKNYFQIKIGKFEAEFDEVSLEGAFLKHKLAEFEFFSNLKSSRIEFKPTEPYFGMVFTYNARKNILVKGFVQHPVGIGPKLDFEFETDLSYFDQFSSGIRNILDLFPAR